MSAPRKSQISLEKLMQAAQAIETPRIVQRWAIAMAAVMSVVAITLAAAIVVMLPLKEMVPYFVVERGDGSVARSDAVGRRFDASDGNLQYFGARFVRQMFTIDEQMRVNLPQSHMFTRGAAMAQWRAFVQTDDRPQARMVEDPSLRRQVDFDGAAQIINTGEGARSGVIIFFVSKTTSTARGRQPPQRVRLTLDYILSPPADLAQALQNPIGFYVTNIRYEVIN